MEFSSLLLHNLGQKIFFRGDEKKPPRKWGRNSVCIVVIAAEPFTVEPKDIFDPN